MEEGEFVKWKQIVVGLISIMMIFTSVRGEVNENQRSNYQMLEQIEKSYVVDSGFRESNYFFLDMVDSYATYYLQCIKQLIGEEDSVERTDVSYEINCLSNKAVDQWNLLDVYSLIMLVDDVKQIPETLESSIIMYLDSLFDENNGCYQYSREFSVQDSIAPYKDLEQQLKGSQAMQADPENQQTAYKELQTEHERLKTEYETVKTLCERTLEAYNAIQNDYKALQVELQQIRTQSHTEPHNARNAGRKPKFTNEQMEQVRKMAADGLSVRKIAAEMSCSIGLVCKILHSNKN